MSDIKQEITALSGLSRTKLIIRWRQCYKGAAPDRLSLDMLRRGIAYKLQEQTSGGLSQSTKRKLRTLAKKLRTADRATFDMAIRPGR